MVVARLGMQNYSERTFSACSAMVVNNSNAPVYRITNGGTIASGPPYFTGYSVTVSCANGAMNGNSLAICNSGAWIPTMGTCPANG